jgi:hypothetical protein
LALGLDSDSSDNILLEGATFLADVFEPSVGIGKLMLTRIDVDVDRNQTAVLGGPIRFVVDSVLVTTEIAVLSPVPWFVFAPSASRTIMSHQTFLLSKFLHL